MRLLCLSVQSFHIVAIKNCFGILLLALATLIGIKGDFEVKISVIFSKEIVNCVILSKSVSAKPAM